MWIFQGKSYIPSPKVKTVFIVHTHCYSEGRVLCVCIYNSVSQEEWTKLRESVPYVKIYDITQNTYIQSWTVTEIMAREKCGLLAVPRTVPGSRDLIPICCALSALVYSRLKRVPRCDCTCKVLGNPKDNYDMSACVFVVQFNGFMSFTS